MHKRAILVSLTSLSPFEKHTMMKRKPTTICIWWKKTPVNTPYCRPQKFWVVINIEKRLLLTPSQYNMRIPFGSLWYWPVICSCSLNESPWTERSDHNEQVTRKKQAWKTSCTGHVAFQVEQHLEDVYQRVQALLRKCLRKMGCCHGGRTIVRFLC